MGTLPVLKPREVAGLLEDLGFVEVTTRVTSTGPARRWSGNTVPFHLGQDISPTLLHETARDIWLAAEQLLGRA